MNKVQKQLEEYMDKYLVKKAPLQLPENGKKTIVDWAPWIALVFGVLSVLSALSLWGLARRADDLVNYSNEFTKSYGIESATQDVGVMVYLTILVVAAQGVILLAAFKGLQDKSKRKGWDLLLLGVVLGFVYSVVTLFIDSYYRGSANIIFSIFGALIGLYVLAQIKDHYSIRPTSKK